MSLSTVELKNLHNIIRKTAEPRVYDNGFWNVTTPKQYYVGIDSYEQITINNRDFKNGIVFDVDEPDKYIPPDISPYTSTYNNDNDKQHALFLFDEPIITVTPKQKEWYRDNVGSVLSKIYFLANSDTRYRNTTTKNPFNKSMFRVFAHDRTLKSVFDLIGLYNNDLAEIGKIESSMTKEDKYISANYRILISQLIEHSQLNAKLLFSNRTQFELTMHLKAQQIREQTTLSAIDTRLICVDAIARSTAWADEVSKRQKMRINSRWGNQVEENKLAIKNAMNLLNITDKKMTMKNISGITGMKLNTLQKDKSYSSYIKATKCALML